MRRRQIGSLAAVAVAFVAVQAGAVTYQWQSAGPVPGVDGTVYAAITWDPDGPGPQPEMLIVGGLFKVAGDVVANNVAAWDGQQWHPLGEGISGDVYSLATYNGQLIASSASRYLPDGTSIPSYIARFDGNSWQPLGEGLNKTVYALAVYNGHLLAAGDFSYNARFPDFRPWDGIAAWDGQQWRPFTDGFSGGGTISVMTVYNGDLIIAGHLNYAPTDTCCIARWDGQAWQALGDGLNIGTSGSSVIQEITDMVVLDGKLIVGKDTAWSDTETGRWQRLGTLASWDGSAWQTITQDDDFIPNALGVRNNQRYCSGLFGSGDSGVAKWNGTAFEFLPPKTRVSLMTTYRGDLVVAQTGDASASGVARWDGQQWQSLGQGVNFYCTALGSYEGHLLVGGTFYDFGVTTYSGFVSWNSQSLTCLGQSLVGPDASHPNPATITDYNGDMIMGGSFETIAGQSCNGIARWDGQQWHSMDGGMMTPPNTLPDGSTAQPYSGFVGSLVVYNGNLIAGGNFDTAGGVPTGAVACWDGQHWHAMGAGLDGITVDIGPEKTLYEPPSVSTLAVYKGRLYAGGNFTVTGNATCSAIAVWDDNRWEPVPGITALSSQVLSLAVYNDQLVVSWLLQQRWRYPLRQHSSLGRPAVACPQRSEIRHPRKSLPRPRFSPLQRSPGCTRRLYLPGSRHAARRH